MTQRLLIPNVQCHVIAEICSDDVIATSSVHYYTTTNLNDDRTIGNKQANLSIHGHMSTSTKATSQSMYVIKQENLKLSML